MAFLLSESEIIRESLSLHLSIKKKQQYFYVFNLIISFIDSEKSTKYKLTGSHDTVVQFKH